MFDHLGGFLETATLSSPRRDPATMAASPAVLALLARQDGLITVTQAVQCGVPERTLRRWTQDGIAEIRAALLAAEASA